MEERATFNCQIQSGAFSGLKIDGTADCWHSGDLPRAPFRPDPSQPFLAARFCRRGSARVRTEESCEILSLNKLLNYTPSGRNRWNLSEFLYLAGQSAGRFAGIPLGLASLLHSRLLIDDRNGFPE